MQITLKFSDGTLVNYGSDRDESDRLALLRCIQKGLHKQPTFATVWEPAIGHRRTGQIMLTAQIDDERFDTRFEFVGDVEEEWTG